MKGNSTMKKIILFLSIFIVVAIACDLGVTVAPTPDPASPPTNTVIPESGNSTEILASPTSIPETAIPTVPPTSSAGTEVTYGSLTLVIPPEVADGASGKEYPRVDSDDAAGWQKTPGHLQVMLGDYYVLQGKFHQPQIYVYPATEYAVLVPGAFESMHRLRNVMNVSSASISADQLPGVPFFNAAQVFASNIQFISFQNGSGIRFLTEYAQYPAPVNNYELFYHFQGFSDDGEYYIVAILPVTVPVLAETSDPGAVLPPGGVPYPDITNTDVGLQDYYGSVTDLLNATSPDAFTPTLGQLDALIQSMLIAP
jgi:hypothetical protein